MSEYKQVSEKPKRYCHKCDREVYQTIHWIGDNPGFYADWFEQKNKAYCITCYRSRMEKKKKK